jgi:hypothetical protein
VAHTHSRPTTPEPEAAGGAGPRETLLQTLVAPFRPKPHSHCEACDLAQDRRERRNKQHHCCVMVALTFMVLFICLAVVGVVTQRAKAH